MEKIPSFKEAINDSLKIYVLRFDINSLFANAYDITKSTDVYIGHLKTHPDKSNEWVDMYCWDNNHIKDCIYIFPNEYETSSMSYETHKAYYVCATRKQELFTCLYYFMKSRGIKKMPIKPKMIPIVFKIAFKKISKEEKRLPLL